MTWVYLSLVLMASRGGAGVISVDRSGERHSSAIYREIFEKGG